MKKILCLAFYILNFQFANAKSVTLQDLATSSKAKNTLEVVRDESLLNLFFTTNKISKEIIPYLEIADEEVVLDIKRQRMLRTLKLTNTEVAAVKDVRLTISSPAEMTPGAQYPVIFILPGLYSEKDILYFIQNPGNNIVVSYQYSYSHLTIDSLSNYRDLPSVVMNIPVQVSSAIHWIKQQEWADNNRISLLGVSLGGHLLPLCQRFMQAQGIYVNASIMAYAGSNTQEIFRDSIDKKMGRRETKLAVELLGALLRPFDPKTHLPFLLGQFLVVKGSEDTLIPAASTQAMYDALMLNKEMITIEGGHINAAKPELIVQLNEVIFSWLSQVNAVQ